VRDRPGSDRGSAVTIRSMSALVWSSLAVSLIAVVAGVVIAVRRGLTTFRATRAFQRKLDGELAPVRDGAAALEGKVASLSDAPVRLERSGAGLRRSTAGVSFMLEQSRDARLVLRLIRFVRS
jgi:hypothetical protein